MSLGQQRWVCAQCGSNNMPQVPACFKCGAPQMLPQVQPLPHAQPAIPRPNDVCSVLSAALSTVGLALICFNGWVFSLAAFVLGAVGLARTGRNSPLNGRAWAWTGLAISLASLSHLGLMVADALPTPLEMREAWVAPKPANVPVATPPTAPAGEYVRAKVYQAGDPIPHGRWRMPCGHLLEGPLPLAGHPTVANCEGGDTWTWGQSRWGDWRWTPGL